MKTNYINVPGRGLMNQTAFDLRMDYLETLAEDIKKDVKSDSILLSQIQNNIESFIGTIEIPLGLVGPLLFLDKNKEPEDTEGKTVVEVNRLTRPGVAMHGSVKFASGAKADWILDQMGRVGFEKSEGSPTPEDIQEFQEELQKSLGA